VIVLLAAVFLASTSAFNTDVAPPAVRFAYWSGVMLAGGLIGAAVLEAFGRRGWLEDRPWLQGVATTVAISLPETVVVWAASAATFDQPWRLQTILLPFPSVLLVSAAVVALNHLAARRPVQTHEAVAGAPASRFLDRLPPRLRGAELHAVEAEDHYLRLHTARGSDLILMRLGDALAELEGLEGAQTHRSWWVARQAVVEARRADGRAVLKLKSGVEAPVSRTYARALRDAGWF
jgi:DNA-binding LytR/AlgR family response regulator